jgi:hypothetical protein
VTHRERPGFDQTKAWEVLLNRAYGWGIPIVSSLNQQRTLNAAAQSLLRDRYMFDAEGNPAQPAQPTVNVDDFIYSYLAAPGLDPERVSKAIQSNECIVRMTILKGKILVEHADVRRECRETAGGEAAGAAK